MLCFGCLSLLLFIGFFPSALITSKLAEFAALCLLSKDIFAPLSPCEPHEQKIAGFGGSCPGSSCEELTLGPAAFTCEPGSLIRDIGRGHGRALRWENGSFGDPRPQPQPGGTLREPRIPSGTSRAPQGTPHPFSPGGIPPSPSRESRAQLAGTPRVPQGSSARREPRASSGTPASLSPGGTPSRPHTVPAHLGPPGQERARSPPGWGGKKRCKSSAEPACDGGERGASTKFPGGEESRNLRERRRRRQRSRPGVTRSPARHSSARPGPALPSPPPPPPPPPPPRAAHTRRPRPAPPRQPRRLGRVRASTARCPQGIPAALKASPLPSRDPRCPRGTARASTACSPQGIPAALRARPGPRPPAALRTSPLPSAQFTSEVFLLLSDHSSFPQGILAPFGASLLPSGQSPSPWGISASLRSISLPFQQFLLPSGTIPAPLRAFLLPSEEKIALDTREC